MQKWRRSPDTSVRGSRSFHAKTKSKPASLHRHGAREKSGILNINTLIFFNSSARTGGTKQTYGEKSWGHRPFWDFFFKKPLFPIAMHTKNTHAIWSTFRRWSAKKFEPRLPETVWTWFQQNFGTFMFKNQNDGATLKQSEPLFRTINFWMRFEPLELFFSSGQYVTLSVFEEGQVGMHTTLKAVSQLLSLSAEVTQKPYSGSSTSFQRAKQTTSKTVEQPWPEKKLKEKRKP